MSDSDSQRSGSQPRLKVTDNDGATAAHTSSLKTVSTRSDVFDKVRRWRSSSIGDRDRVNLEEPQWEPALSKETLDSGNLTDVGEPESDSESGEGDLWKISKEEQEEISRKASRSVVSLRLQDGGAGGGNGNSSESQNNGLSPASASGTEISESRSSLKPLPISLKGIGMSDQIDRKRKLIRTNLEDSVWDDDEDEKLKKRQMRFGNDPGPLVNGNNGKLEEMRNTISFANTSATRDGAKGIQSIRK